MPALNEMYQDYGCNKGDLIFIMDGINVYHDKMVAKYRDSLGGIFPMLAINDNMDSLHFIKADFPGAAPTYALISPSKEILYSGRTKSEFLAAVESLNLKKKPDLCEGTVDNAISEIVPKVQKSVSIIRGVNNQVKIQINESGSYHLKIFSINGKCINDLGMKKYDVGNYKVDINSGRGVYFFKVSNSNENLIVNRSFKF